jgi:MOSC domain-containing protein YiiM
VTAEESPASSGEVVSLNRALPRDVEWRGRRVRTGFFKAPDPGPVRVGTEGLEGDASADTQAHGGPRQAVYAYPAEHYPYWSGEIGPLSLPWGSFGENLTLRGLTEDRVHEGDRLEGAETTLEVTQPRTPCFKLNVRFQRDDMVRRFAAAGRPGFYLAVVRPGELRVGERLRLRPGRRSGASVEGVFRHRMRSPPAPAAELDDI